MLTENDLTINKAWQNLTITYPGMAGQPSYVQNKSFGTDRDLLVVFSDSAVAPTEDNGLRVRPTDPPVSGTANNIWVRAFRNVVTINCGMADQ